MLPALSANRAREDHAFEDVPREVEEILATLVRGRGLQYEDSTSVEEDSVEGRVANVSFG